MSKEVSFTSLIDKRCALFMMILFTLIAILFSLGILIYNNPVPIDSPSFIPIVKRRAMSVVVMFLVALSQSTATIGFQAITHNRIITPSIMGMDALYIFFQTASVFIWGIDSLVHFSSLPVFILECLLMIFVSLILYAFWFKGSGQDLYLMLIAGIILSTGLNAFSAFMRRTLSPAEYDVLQANILGSVMNADSEKLWIAFPVIIIAAVSLWLFSQKLNILSLGKDIATNLGLDHRKQTIYILILITILIATCTALIGRLTFFGFLVTTLTYLLMPSYDYKYLLPFSFSLGFMIFTGAYFLMNHFIPVQGVVSILIEIFGGISFLIILLRRGRL